MDKKIRFVRCKSKVDKDGHYFWNYYLIFGEGNPIQIKLAFNNPNVYKLLYACSDEVQITMHTEVK